MSNIDLKRRTKIVATIGPATQSEEIITDLIKAGVTTFRLNFSHGDHNDHAERIKTIREVSTKLDIDVGILQDLQGPNKPKQQIVSVTSVNSTSSDKYLRI